LEIQGVEDMNILDKLRHTVQTNMDNRRISDIWGNMNAANRILTIKNIWEKYRERFGNFIHNEMFTDVYII